MKKTVIAAALASTVFSGAAMAWTAGGTGGNIEIGGNIQVTPYTTPWEVEVGAPANTLNANITKGTSVVMIPVTTAIPVLGIRTKTGDSFHGVDGINPQISYNGAVQIDTFNQGVAAMSLPVVDADNPTTEIGALETQFAAAAVSSWWASDTDKNQYSTFSDTAGQAFWGGVGKTAASVVPSANVLGMMNSLNAQYSANYTSQTVTGFAAPAAMKFSTADALKSFSAAYGAGIQAGTTIKLTLTNPAANDLIKWKASLPVTVSYQ
ncbi:TPA: fimbrial protein [Salmonella enterica subsp. enterica serovar Virchow]